MELTEVFDRILAPWMEQDSCGWCEPDGVVVFEILIKALEDFGWDRHKDSKYYNDPDIQEILRKLHPDWFEDDKE